MTTRKLPSQSLLCTLFRYQPKTGRLMRGGKPCGKKVSIMNKDYWSSRVVWKMMTGREPVDVIDYRDGDATNLKWRNLVELTHAQLRLIGAAHSTSTTGLRGVYKIGGRKYRAAIWRGGRKVHLGTFATATAAGRAREAARRRIIRCG